MAGEIHKSKVGTYHPAPEIIRCQTCKEKSGGKNTSFYGTCHKFGPVSHAFIAEHCNDTAWTIHDTRGTIDGGPACDECGACDCGEDQGCRCDCLEGQGCRAEGDEPECIGLSFAYVCLDGGEVLCEECAEKAGITIVECDCHD